LERSDLDSPILLDLCPGHASHVIPTHTGVGGNRSMPDPVIACGSGFCKLRSLILSAMKSKDPKANLEPGKNLVADLNAIDFT
jgi:hypothetical protein